MGFLTDLKDYNSDCSMSQIIQYFVSESEAKIPNPFNREFFFTVLYKLFKYKRVSQTNIMSKFYHEL